MPHTNHTVQILIGSLIIAAVPLLGEVKMQVRDGRPIVDGVYVNGHGPYRFLVDTGANINLIEASLARKIGMNPTFQVDLASAAGKTQSQGSDGNEVVIDAVKMGGQKFLLSGLEALHNSLPDVRGVLGQWFLAQFDYRLDLRGKRLEFGKQDRNGARSSLRMVNARPVVSTNLGDLVLDSGAVRVILFGVDAGSGGNAYVRTVTGSQAAGKVSKSLTIEGRTFWRGDAAAMPEGGEPGVAGLLPLSMFKSIYVCNSEGYVVFE